LDPVEARRRRLAALAGQDALAAADRGLLLVGLFQLAAQGRAVLYETADWLVALGRPVAEGPAETAARLAVERAVPGLLSRWDVESEGGRFTLAALAAACPGISQPVRSEVRALRDRYSGTRWGRAANLALALLAGDDGEILAGTARLREAYDADYPTSPGSPYAPVESRALWFLNRMFG